jgi:hypothetical protein
MDCQMFEIVSPCAKATIEEIPTKFSFHVEPLQLTLCYFQKAMALYVYDDARVRVRILRRLTLAVNTIDFVK